MLRLRELGVVALGVTALWWSPPSRAADCTPWNGGESHTVKNGDATLKVKTIGAGQPVIFVPSIGRGVGDFDQLATRVADAGYLAVLPDPRGIDGSDGPMSKIKLGDLAADVLAVAKSACAGPVAIVGHAFGGRIAARAAAMGKELVSRIVLLAVSAPGPIAPALKSALGGSAAQGYKSQESRLADLEKAYFAPGNDARSWLDGWHPLVASSQNRASTRSDREDWSAVSTPALVLWGESDVVGTWADVQDIAHAKGQRVTLVRVPRAGRALLPEQPEAIAAAVVAYLQDKKADYDALVRANLRAAGNKGAAAVDATPRG